MKLCYFANWAYKDILPVTIKSAHTLGYETHVYDIGGLGMGTQWDNKTRGFRWIRTQTVKVYRQLREMHSGWLAFMDSDIVLRKRFDEIEGDYDVVLVDYMGTKAPHGGLVAVNDTQGARDFLDLTIAVIGDNDQRALRWALAENLDAKIKWVGPEYCWNVKTTEDLDVLPDVSVVHFLGQGWKMSRIDSKKELLRYYIDRTTS